MQQWATMLSPGLILDAGSGTGVYRPLLENAGHRVIALDLSVEMLTIQLRKFPTAVVLQARLEALPIQDCEFDYVLCTRVLSHVEILGPVFNEFARITKPAARLLITDVHPDHRYSEMSIPTDRERVSIETYKHPIPGIKQALRSSGFELTEFSEQYFRDLAWKPPLEKFENIYADLERPISYIGSLRRS